MFFSFSFSSFFQALLEKLSRLFAGLRESHFLAWKKHVGVMNSVRSFMGGSDVKTKRRHFTRWKLRKHYATTPVHLARTFLEQRSPENIV